MFKFDITKIVRVWDIIHSLFHDNHQDSFMDLIKLFNFCLNDPHNHNVWTEFTILDSPRHIKEDRITVTGKNVNAISLNSLKALSLAKYFLQKRALGIKE